MFQRKFSILASIPTADDKKTIKDILGKDFPTWKGYIIAQAKKHINKELVKEATTKATNAILPIVKQPIKQVKNIYKRALPDFKFSFVFLVNMIEKSVKPAFYWANFDGAIAKQKVNQAK